MIRARIRLIDHACVLSLKRTSRSSRFRVPWEGKPCVLFYSTGETLYQALDKALHAGLGSRLCWLARLDEPEPLVDALRDLGEDLRRISVLQFGGLRAGIAGMSPKVAEGRRQRIAVPGTRQPGPIERRPPCDRARRALSLPAKLHDAPGNLVRILLHFLGHPGEQLAQGQQRGSFGVPVGLSALQLQIDGVG